MQIPEIEIIVTKEGVELLRKTVRPGDYVIGRDPSCEVHLDVELVSRRHALFTVNFDHVLVEDLGSSNGTFVNGQPVKEPTRLWPNQKIQIGAATIELRRIKTLSSPGASLAPQTAAMQLLLPEELLRDKKYRIGKVVAQGGMGAILDARETTIERQVAMKVMLDGSSADDLVRFVAEAKITGQLEHPNVIPVHELSVDENGQPFYTMKMVRGITLKKVFDLLAAGVAETARKYPLPALLTIFQKVGDAIAFAHSKGVIHRDLKPENIMLDDFGVVLVMDWGLAKVIDQADAPVTDVTRGAARTLSPEANGATLAGSIMGTPQYMSPEQARGEVEILDARSDVYALGAILYHILALRPPVNGNDVWEIVRKVAGGHVEPLTPPKNRSIPDSIAAVVRKAMSFDRDQRYPRVADLQGDIEAYQNGRATRAEKAGLGRHFLLALKRHKTLAAAVALVLLSGGGFGMNAIMEGRRATREAARANQALADLKKTAPALRQLAASEAGFQRFESALQKLDAALVLDPADPGSFWQRAWIFIGLEKWSDAVVALRVAAGKDPANARLADITPMLEELAATPEAQRWTTERVAHLTQYLETAGASGELAALSDKMRLGAEPRRKLVEDRVRQWLGPQFASRVGIIGAGLVQASLDNLNVDTVEPLHGLPIDRLNLAGDHVTTLEPLRGMKLSFLELFANPVTDISPLQGMPLRDLVLSGTKIQDFSPLRGAPLESITAYGFNLVDISFLSGAPLRKVFMGGNRVTDLQPLASGPLETLLIQGSQITDLSPLRGKPLRIVSLAANRIRDLGPLRGAPIIELSIEGNPIQDYAPLLDLPKLEKLSLGGDPKTFLVLRRHPTLKYISTGNGLFRPVADFWKEYDAQHPAAPK